MTGRIVKYPRQPHQCDPGVVTQTRNGRAVYADVPVDSEWACDDCGRIWVLQDRGDWTQWTPTARALRQV